ncbi:polysaccharide lyase family 1 protein [Amniculicola lignicola CBS 123094]|uniref:Polysaccharide lyase family 1 protein n=1 Tax=Amniculicola lignicola CBS 123094 TaxID=1392246 RepID=A0A6A5WDZ9_9PLEO|nr:polysaccharide lyase family 1 protein [Amniculicola lignicola CBS 123094]
MHLLTSFAVALAAGSTALAAPLERRAAKVNELVGYAAGTTGGGSGTGTTVTTCAALTAAAKVGGVIKINGVLAGCGIIKVISNTSILGVGAASGLTGSGFQVRLATNVIIRNLKLSVAPEGKDLIDIDESTKVWIDHMDLASVGLTGDKDTYDGLLDAKHGSDFLTFSWIKFHDHWKGSLVGHSDNNAAEDTGKLHVTYHHNLFENVNSRLPSVRFGTAHIYSSCYISGLTSGINSRMGAQVFVEETSFTNTNLAIVTNLDSDLPGSANEKNNLYANSPTRITQKGTYTPTYAYTVDPAASACAIARASAGVGIVTF